MAKESPLLTTAPDQNIALRAAIDLIQKGTQLIYVSVMQVYHNELTDLL